MSVKNEVAQQDKKENPVKWQTQKSSMTRYSLLDAATDCFVKLGFSKLTTTKVADIAGVSRGAMRHHFASKKELVEAAVEHLHKKLLESYFENIRAVPESLTGRERIRGRLDAYWNYINSDLFRAYQELCMTARTEPELKELLEKSVKDFEYQARKSTVSFFSEWEGHSDKLFFAIDTSKFMLEGMASGQIETNKKQRVARQLDYLAGRIEEILTDDGTTELSKYFSQ